MTRYVIHNHIPAKRSKDSSGAFLSSERKPKEGDPDYKRWAEQQRREQNRGGGEFHNDAVLTKKQIEAKIDDLNYKIDRVNINSKNWFDLDKERKALYKQLHTAPSEDSRDFRGVVNRDQEERNRDRMYRDTGITRN